MTSIVVDGPRSVVGSITVPGDKSVSHRALLLGALAEGTSSLVGLSPGDDVARTAAAVGALGALFTGTTIVGGRARLHGAGELDLGNSGTSMRLLAGVCATLPGQTVLTGDRSLSRRPMDRVAEPLRRMGAAVVGHGAGCRPPLVVEGATLRGIEYHLPVPSAQVKGAVLLAGLAAEGETVTREHVRTRTHTEEMLEAFGADIELADDGLTVRLRPGPLQPTTVSVPGDPSQAAFWVVAASITPGSRLEVEPVYVGPARAGFLDVLDRMGADITIEAIGRNTARLHVRAAELRATEVGGDEIPGLIDEIPVLAVAATAAEGTTVFRDAAELRVKETDRITTMTAGLAALGAAVEATADGLIVRGGSRLRASQLDSAGDHRVAMAMAVAGLTAEGSTRIKGWDAVATSYPGFEKDLERLCR